MSQHRIRKLLPPPQQRSATRRQFMKTERLQQTIVRPQVQALYSLLNLAPARQHQHRSLIEPAPQLRQHLGAILPRKTQVKHYQIRPLFGSLNQRRLSIPHPGNLMPLYLQSLLQKKPKRHIVFNNQHSHPVTLQGRKSISTAATLPIPLCVITLVHYLRSDKCSSQIIAGPISKWESPATFDPIPSPPESLPRFPGSPSPQKECHPERSAKRGVEGPAFASVSVGAVVFVALKINWSPVLMASSFE